MSSVTFVRELGCHEIHTSWDETGFRDGESEWARRRVRAVGQLILAVRVGGHRSERPAGGERCAADTLRRTGGDDLASDRPPVRGCWRCGGDWRACRAARMAASASSDAKRQRCREAAAMPPENSTMSFHSERRMVTQPYPKLNRCAASVQRCAPPAHCVRLQWTPRFDRSRASQPIDAVHNSLARAPQDNLRSLGGGVSSVRRDRP
jgi:hypothetical protein